MLQRLGRALVASLLLLLVVLALAACDDDGDDAEATDGDAAAADYADDEEADEDDDDNDEPGDGDESASTWSFRDDELDVRQVECRGQFDRDGTEMRVYAPDPEATDDDRWEELVLAVDQRDEGGAEVAVRYADPLDGDAFDGHRWSLPGEERDQVEISEDGTSGDFLLELNEGADGPAGHEDAEVSFDIVC